MHAASRERSSEPCREHVSRLHLGELVVDGQGRAACVSEDERAVFRGLRAERERSDGTTTLRVRLDDAVIDEQA